MLEIMMGANRSGEAVFITPGNHTWIVPKGVDSICAVAVDAGGSGNRYFADTLGFIISGGAGGSLRWDNSITVTPGEILTIFVADSLPPGDANSHLSIASTLSGHTFGNVHPGGTNRISTSSNDIANVGGSGAGGYSDTGGRGGLQQVSFYSPPDSGSGGGAAGGDSTEDGFAGCGGGVGIFGQGASGIASTGSYGIGGAAGSGGVNGDNAGAPGASGGEFGGGGASALNVSGRRRGGQGAVRIIWGKNRAFPSTKTGRQFSQKVEEY